MSFGPLVLHSLLEKRMNIWEVVLMKARMTIGGYLEALIMKAEETREKATFTFMDAQYQTIKVTIKIVKSLIECPLCGISDFFYAHRKHGKCQTIILS